MSTRPPLDSQSELARLRAIAKVAAAKGWGHYAERLGFGRDAVQAPDSSEKSDAIRLREALEELGPTFVKFGQMVSGRTDLFPEELTRHLLHASNRLAFALIIAPIVVGSAIVIGANAGPSIEGVPILGIIGFVVAGALGLAWVVIALKSGKL